MKKILLLTVILASAIITTVNAQTKIKDGTVTGTSSLPNSNAILELESNNKGLLLPRVALTMTTNPSPLSAHVKGMTVYNTVEVNDVDSGLYFNDGTKWVRLSSSVDSATAWLLHGNSGTNAGTNLVGNSTDGNYVGTVDAQNMVIATNRIKRMIFDTLSNAWGGKNNLISNATTQDFDHGGFPATSFMWGINNTDSSYLNTVFGTNNKITGNLHSNIITGEQDTIGGSWGWGNAMFGVNNFLTVQNGGGNIVSGIQNRRVGNNISNANGGALFGYQNIDSSYFGSIVGGSNNMLGTGAGNSVVGGLLNTISTPSFQAWAQGMASSNAVFGSSNTILSSTSSSNANLNFVSGGSNKLINANSSAAFGNSNIDSASASIVAGSQNILYSTTGSSAVFGQNNTLGGTGSLITGTQNTSIGNNNLVYGQSNTIADPNAGLNFVGGVQNTIVGNASSNIVVGGGNTLTTSSTNFGTAGTIIYGSLNTARGWGNLVGGGINGGNTMVYGSQNCVLFGKNNVIGTSFSGENFVTGESDTTTGADWVTVAGFGLNSINSYETVIGKYNTPVTNALFTVGNGTSSSGKSNAITVMNTTPAPIATANNSTLNVNGSVSASFVSVTTDYTLTASDYTVNYTGNGGTFPTFTLPDPGTCKGRIYIIRNGAPLTTFSSITLSYPIYQSTGTSGFTNVDWTNSIKIQSDGSLWWEIP